jgi:hypothetical protein
MLRRHCLRAVLAVIVPALAGAAGCADSSPAAGFFTARPATVSQFDQHMWKQYGARWRRRADWELRAAVRIEYGGPGDWIDYRYEIWRNGKPVPTSRDWPGEKIVFPDRGWLLLSGPHPEEGAERRRHTVRIDLVSEDPGGEGGYGRGGGASFVLPTPAGFRGKLTRLDLEEPVRLREGRDLAVWGFVPAGTTPGTSATGILQRVKEADWAVVLVVSLGTR